MFPALEKYRIDILSALILVALTLAAGIFVFVVMQRHTESILSQSLASLLQSNERSFQNSIEQSLLNTESAARRPFVIQNLQFLVSKPGNAAKLVDLQRIAKSISPDIFTGLSFYDIRGHEVARAGKFSQKHELRVSLKSNNRAFLLWDGQFILQASRDILDPQGRRIGMVATESMLPLMSDTFADIATIGKTGEFAMCALLADDDKNMDCFLNRTSGKVFKRFPRMVENKPLPMSYALNGENGIIDTKDYRNEQVIAAYAPVGAFGLGIVMKVNKAELHQPVMAQLKFIVPLLLALLLIGMLLLNFLVRPLVRKLVNSERETHDVNISLHDTQEKLRSIYEGSNDAIMLQDENGFIDCNARTLEMFGLQDKAEFIGHNPAEFSPPVQPDGRASMLAATDYIANALQSGRKRFEWVSRRKNGEDFPAEVLLSAFSYGGEKILQASVRDITNRKKNVEKIHQLNTELSQFKSTLDQTLDCVFMFRLDTLCFTYVNQGAMQQTGYSEAELLQMTPVDIKPKITLEQFQQIIQPLIDGVQPSITFQTLHRHKDGHDIPVEIFLQLVRLEGQDPRFVAMVSDITERKQAEATLEKLSAFYKLDLVGLTITSPDKGWVSINDCLCKMFEYSEQELLSMTWAELTHPDDLAADVEQFTKLLANEIQGYGLEKRFVSKSGKVIPTQLVVRCTRKDNGEVDYVMAMVQDISERKAAQEKIEFLAYHDVLTRLPNRLLAKDHLEQAILVAERENSKVALLFVDLDKFKTINDSLGHVIGDGLLKSVAIRLRECLRDIDTLSRQGGDEFLIVLNNMRDTESVNVVAEKILERMAEPFEIDHHELAISLSIGIAVYPDDGKDFDTLLKQSDTAMYQAKELGRNTYSFHTAQMNIDAIEHLRMRNGLRHALEHGEFILHYQPQISLASGAVIGAEALIRWNHPELGMVAPGRFISVAEDSGLIVPIGEWVLREACRQSVAWRKAGLPELLIAVNLSAVQFKRGDVLKNVTQALAESGLDPALLELELTESILIKDTEKVLATVRQLKSLGLKLSIDDFGTGYSSLSYLKQFKVDKLKIDQSFVRDMADDPDDAAIVRAIIQMAKSLNLTTIAEGVEDEHQLALLRLQHCDEVQGYHFARPMPADELADFMRKTLAKNM